MKDHRVAREGGRVQQCVIQKELTPSPQRNTKGWSQIPLLWQPLSHCDALCCELDDHHWINESKM